MRDYGSAKTSHTNLWSQETRAPHPRFSCLWLSNTFGKLEEISLSLRFCAHQNSHACHLDRRGIVVNKFLRLIPMINSTNRIRADGIILITILASFLAGAVCKLRRKQYISRYSRLYEIFQKRGKSMCSRVYIYNVYLRVE